MTLYNKDGSVYRLSGPNPIMKEQNMWTKFIVHNMKWKPDYREDGTIILPLESDLSLNPKMESEIFLDELSVSKEKQKEEKNEIISSKEEDKLLKIPVKEKVNKSITTKSNDSDIEKTFIYCLPAKVKEKRDNLYGEVFKTVLYENPTSFEAVILSQTDMGIEMWSDSVYEKETILYPKNNDKRWWKISEIHPKLGGWIIRGIPSQDQPSFES